MNNRKEVSEMITKGLSIYGKLITATLPAVIQSMSEVEELSELDAGDLPEFNIEVTQANASTTSICVSSPDYGLVDVHIRIARLEVYE